MKLLVTISLFIFTFLSSLLFAEDFDYRRLSCQDNVIFGYDQEVENFFVIENPNSRTPQRIYLTKPNFFEKVVEGSTRTTVRLSVNDNDTYNVRFTTYDLVWGPPGSEYVRNYSCSLK